MHRGERTPPPARSHLGAKIRFAAAVRAQILERQIEPPLRQIDRDVAEDVGQLQGDAEIGRVLRAPPDRARRRCSKQIKPTAEATRMQYS